MKINIKPLDALFSKLTRKERPICEVCKRRSSTQVHHYFGRRHKSVRFDDMNIVSLCFPCHRKMHEDPEFGRDWMLRKLGQDKYDNLVLRKNTIGKPDYALLKIYFKQKMKYYLKIS